MFDTGWDGLNTPRLQPFDNLKWQQGRCNVDIGHRQPKQCIAHRAANITWATMDILQQRENFYQAIGVLPFCVGKYSGHVSLRTKLAIIPAVTPHIRRSPHWMS